MESLSARDIQDRLVHPLQMPMPDIEWTEARKRMTSWSIMARTGRKGTYEGTVPVAVVAKRRKRDRAAKQARKAHRG